MRTPSEWVHAKFAQWNRCSLDGYPHGALVMEDAIETDIPQSLIILQEGDQEGTCDIGFAMLSQQQGKGLGTKIVKAIVEQWAPEVRRIGLGRELDLEKDAAIIGKLKCFGGEVLERLVATAHPENVRSGHILEKVGFGSAVCDEDTTLEIIDMSATRVETYGQLAEALLKRFDATCDRPLQPGTHYQLVDHTGKLRIVSYKQLFNSLRFHFEKRVE